MSRSFDFSVQNLEPLIGKNNSGKKWTLVLDLDETLIHTFCIDPEKLNFYTRPGSHKFLEDMAKNYELIIFTAASEDYANPIIDYLDP